MTNKRLFWIAVALQVLVLLSLVARHSYTLSTGQTIVLGTAPVDPWEVFRGQYVQLSYKISTLRASEVDLQGLPYRGGQEIWVTLKKGTPFWTAVAASATRPQVLADHVAVRATVEWANSDVTRPSGEPAQAFVHYGIEQFYVPEGQGQDIERSRAELSVEAKVDSFGRAAIYRVLVNGKDIQWK